MDELSLLKRNDLPFANAFNIEGFEFVRACVVIG